MPKSIISISLETTLVEEIQRISHERDQAVSHIVNDALQEYLRRRKRGGRVMTVREVDQVQGE